jgi:prepilin-type N-terminal cleavage/methylation domain-containing protein
MIKVVRTVRKHRGVTLLEVLVTVAIMSLLATVAGIAVFHLHREQLKKVAVLNASLLRRAAGAWRLNRASQECPSFSRLRAEGTLDREASPFDPWGCPFLITCAEDEVTVTSSGPDRKAGTDDDIVAPPEAVVAKGL